MDVSGRFEKGARSFYPSAPPQTAAKSSSFCDVSSGDCVYLIFKYAPMGGLVIAFKRYNFSKGIWGSDWAGLYYFQMLFSGPATLNIIRNTFVLSVLRILFGFPAPIILALLLNEMRCERYKKALQTVLYIPHFFSWVIVGGIVSTVFSQETGIINAIIKHFTGEPYPFLYREGSWIAIFIGAGVWKEWDLAPLCTLRR